MSESLNESWGELASFIIHKNSIDIGGIASSLSSQPPLSARHAEPSRRSTLQQAGRKLHRNHLSTGQVKATAAFRSTRSHLTRCTALQYVQSSPWQRRLQTRK